MTSIVFIRRWYFLTAQPDVCILEHGHADWINVMEVHRDCGYNAGPPGNAGEFNR